MKLAFASNQGATLDCHFGQCSSFTISELDEAGYRLTELREVPEAAARSRRCSINYTRC
ncbi:NifB/NifX family molybdenum-iron cluster-binding protein [Paenibacillus camerounensis]|uniref:NifB/NifX family molybdenum-iron cluster-binding protein n=1 Tax=Paenibacillus camerounensis TaxID=1243663 RepID=UPI000A6D5D17|nr:NifB/NifX family molybdenum-iron cluster-binding protein [Paenibacillus camerounensis]